jgi:hypothetical protein
MPARECEFSLGFAIRLMTTSLCVCMFRGEGGGKVGGYAFVRG